MLHGLSHALMAEIGLESGYLASALQERINAVSDRAGPGATARYAFTPLLPAIRERSGARRDGS